MKMNLAFNNLQMCICRKTKLYHRTNVLCCKERSPQKKKYSNSNVREENIAVVYYSALLFEKLILVVSFFSLLVETGCG